jgi:hypothetical protein
VGAQQGGNRTGLEAKMNTKRDERSPAIFGAARVRPRVPKELAPAELRHVGDGYSAWRIAAAQSGEALRAWLQAEPDFRGTMYVAYRAALDREEAAALDLQGRWPRAQRGTSASSAAR